MPGIVLGVGLFLSYTRPPFVLYGTLWILLIAFLTINLPSAYQQLQAAFATIHPELEEASRILGATRLQSLRQITAPLLRTGVIATWCFIFIGVMRELSAAIVLFTSQTKVLSVLIYDLNESGDLAAISVLGIAMLVITFAVVMAVNRIPMFGGNAATRLRNSLTRALPSLRGVKQRRTQGGKSPGRGKRAPDDRLRVLITSDCYFIPSSLDLIGHDPIRLDLSPEPFQRRGGRAPIDYVFPLASHDSTFRSIAGE